MKKIIALLLVCCMCVGLVACGLTDENATTEPSVTTEPIATTEPIVTTEPIATTPTAAATYDWEFSFEDCWLEEHCQEIPVHCDRWECSRDCDRHCDERCIYHVPHYLGEPVTVPSGSLLVVTKAVPEERYQLMECDVTQISVMEVDPHTQFLVAGVRYLRNTEVKNEQLTEGESDIPLTEEEMGELCAAIPIFTYRAGLVYLIDPQNGDFLLTIPSCLEYDPEWWK